MKVFLDADCCIDYLLERTHFFKTIKIVIDHITDDKNNQVYYSNLTIPNTVYITRKDFSLDQIKSKFLDLNQIIQPIEMSNEILQQVLLDQNFKDFEDAIQYFCARKKKCDFIITRNTADYASGQIPVMTPYEYLDKYLD